MPVQELLERFKLALDDADFLTAIKLAKKCIQQNPENAQAWFLLGVAHHQNRESSEAQNAFTLACALDSQLLQARFGLAAVSLELGDAEIALRSSIEAAQMAPDDPQAYTNLAIAYEALGRLPEALEAYRKALQRAPGFVDALKNKGVLLLALRRFEEALICNQSFAALYPQRFDAVFNLGEACLSCAKFAEAVSAFKKARSLAPQHIPTLLHGGFALALIEDFSESQEWLDTASALNPAEVLHYRQSIIGPEQDASPRLDARALFLLHHYDHIQLGNWSERAYFVERFTQIIKEGRQPLTEKPLAFRALVMGLPANAQLSLARQIAIGIQEKVSKYAANKISGPELSIASNRRLRIGYLSPDFRSHAVSILINSLFALHDRGNFEIFGYSLGKEEECDLRREIKSRVEHFINLDTSDDIGAAERIYNDKIDILVDLAGHTNGSRLGILAQRPAVLQISWLGYLGTLGASWIDYFVADGIIVSPEQEEGYAEAMLRLSKGLFLCSYSNLPLDQIPQRREVGLPETGVVLTAMNTVNKIDPEIFALWMRLLKAIPESTLWLLDAIQPARENLLMTAQQHGIASERLCFAPKTPHAKHRARLQLADLALDTSQCNGHTTTADALSAGVPVLTCIGSLPAQRVAASMLHLSGLDELIVNNLAEYEALALDLLLNPPKLQLLKEKLKAARFTAPFFKPQEWVREFEAGLQQIWERHCAGLPPASMDVCLKSPEPLAVPRKRVTAIY